MRARACAPWPGQTLSPAPESRAHAGPGPGHVDYALRGGRLYSLYSAPSVCTACTACTACPALVTALACTALRPTASQPSLSDGFTTIPVRRLHNHPCPTEHAHRVVHVRTAAGTRAAAEGGANGQCMPLPLLAHAQAEGQGRPAVAHNASFWRSTRLRLSSLAAGA
jgi:hypothetical protein